MKRIFTLLAFLVVCTAVFSQATVTLECYSCEELSGRYCASCQDSEVNYFKGLLVRTPQGAYEINSPFSVLVRGSSVRLTDWQGDIVAFARRDTPYRNMEELMDVINGCNCQGGGSLTPGSVDTDELADGGVTYDKLDQAVKDSISAGGNGLPDGDYGSVTISGSSTAISINSGVVGPDELESTAVTPGTYINATVTLDADGRATAASNGMIPAPSISSVTFDGGRDTLDLESAEELIYQINMGSITRTDTIDVLNPTTAGSYLFHIMSVATDTMTWPSTFLDSHGDEIGTREFTTSTVNMFSAYYDGTNYYTVQAPGNAATLPSVVYDEDYQDVLDYMTLQGYTLPGPTERQAGSDFVAQLKSDGVWTGLDALWVFASGTADENASLVNWKTPGTSNATKVGTGITHSSSTGFTTNTTTGYINSNFDPTTDGSTFTQNSAGIGYYVSSGEGGIGGQDASDYQGGMRVDAGIQYASVFNSKSAGQYLISDTGPYGNSIMGFRTGANDVSVYDDGTLVDTCTTCASVQEVNIDLFIGARNNKGTPDVGRTATYSVVFISNDQSANASNIHSAIATYLSSL